MTSLFNFEVVLNDVELNILTIMMCGEEHIMPFVLDGASTLTHHDKMVIFLCVKEASLDCISGVKMTSLGHRLWICLLEKFLESELLIPQ